MHVFGIKKERIKFLSPQKRVINSTARYEISEVLSK